MLHKKGKTFHRRDLSYRWALPSLATEEVMEGEWEGGRRNRGREGEQIN